MARTPLVAALFEPCSGLASVKCQRLEPGLHWEDCSDQASVARANGVVLGWGGYDDPVLRVACCVFPRASDANTPTKQSTAKVANAGLRLARNCG
jgi:hypothetical protein